MTALEGAEALKREGKHPIISEGGGGSFTGPLDVVLLCDVAVKNF